MALVESEMLISKKEVVFVAHFLVYLKKYDVVPTLIIKFFKDIDFPRFEHKYQQEYYEKMDTARRIQHLNLHLNPLYLTKITELITTYANKDRIERYLETFFGEDLNSFYDVMTRLENFNKKLEFSQHIPYQERNDYDVWVQNFQELMFQMPKTLAFIEKVIESESYPIRLRWNLSNSRDRLSEYAWFYNTRIYYVNNIYDEIEAKMLVISEFDKERRKFESLKAKFEDSEAKSDFKRKSIPEKIRIEVWRRDGGKCAKCESRENLEYDHIIPVSRGGSNTSRNIELLCESCNRSKGAKII
jgi:HNH endonuclease